MYSLSQSCRNDVSVQCSFAQPLFFLQVQHSRSTPPQNSEEREVGRDVEAQGSEEEKEEEAQGWLVEEEGASREG